MALDAVRLGMAQKDKKAEVMGRAPQCRQSSSHVALHTSTYRNCEAARASATAVQKDRLTQARWTYPCVGLPVTLGHSLPHAADGYHAIFYRGSEQRPLLLPPRFHGAPGVEAAPRRTGQNRRVDNELVGAPEEIRTPDPQIVVWCSTNDFRSRRRSSRCTSGRFGSKLKTITPS